MMNQEHVLPLLSDYVLDLLPSGKRQQVELHAAECAACRAALQTERQIGGLVRASLQAAAEPGNGRLAQLMPAVPRQPAPTAVWWDRQRQLALVGLLLVVLLGSWGLRFGQGRHGWQPPLPTSVAVTATNSATATLAEAATSTRVVETAVSTSLASPTAPPATQSSISPTPIPLPTPIAIARPPLAAN
ncbi:MAG: zf-HC2 domain-containing protein [Ardenticatenaceae bacterium]|nr:zf-HC2 domain-containing protein [Ardenticatenaceae bacterium]